MQWCVGLVTIAMLGCTRTADNADPYCGNGVADPYEECDTPGVGDCSEYCTLPTPTVTAHWQFVTLAGGTSDCLPGEPSIEISSQNYEGNRVGFSAPCVGGQATHPLKGAFGLSVSSTLDHTYSTSVPFTLSPTGDLPLATIYSDAGDVWVDVGGLSGFPLNCNPDPYGLASVAVHIDDGVVTELPCMEAYQTRYSLVPAGPHQVFASGYDSTHALVASSAVDFTALGGTQVSVGIAIGRAPR